jgi:hypothetical protein
VGFACTMCVILRGRGLFDGLELDPGLASAAAVATWLIQAGVLTHRNTFALHHR